MGEATRALQLQIGIGLAPVMTQFETGLTGFLENGGAQQIAGAFKTGAQFAESFAGALGAVLPIFGQLAGAFMSMPAPLRDLLVGGIVAQKASSFLFGSGPLQWIKGLLGGASSRGGPLGAVTGALAGGTPVMVTNWPIGLGGPGGLAGTIGGAVEQGAARGLGPIAGLMAKIPGLGGVMSGGGILATILPFVPAIIAAVVASQVFNAWQDQQNQLHKQEADITTKATTWRGSATLAALQSSNAGLQARLNELNSSAAGMVGGLFSNVGLDVTGSEKAKQTIQALIDANNNRIAQLMGGGTSTTGVPQVVVAIRDLRTALMGSVANPAAAASLLTKETLSRGGGSVSTLNSILAVLQHQESIALKKGDLVTVKLIASDIAAIQQRAATVTAKRLAVADASRQGELLAAGPIATIGGGSTGVTAALATSIDSSRRDQNSRLDTSNTKLATLVSTDNQNRDIARRQFTTGDVHTQQKIDQERAQLAGLLAMINGSLLNIPASLKNAMQVNITMTPPSARENKITNKVYHSTGGNNRVQPI